jgi:hypothetical protein
MAHEFFSDNILEVATKALEMFEHVGAAGQWPDCPSQYHLRNESDI